MQEQAQAHGQSSILFVDEVHRFNKAQQDAFLPHLEQGTITLIGATTENPSFQLNNALLSRARVYVLKSLSTTDLLTVIAQALADQPRGYGKWVVNFPDVLRQQLVTFADGDARQALNLLEILMDFAIAPTNPATPESVSEINITADMLADVLTTRYRRFDNGGEAFYDQISALP